jgi:Pyruvate/2-oxoacid:ferredoxin oxidoreductase delta subunit
LGAEVTILYRRTRKEMPAIEREIEEALEEGINIVYLAAPAEILRDDEGKVRAMVVQRMELGEPDSSGRRRPVVIKGDTYELPVETVITAVSQQPDLAALKSEALGTGWLNGDEWGRTEVDGVWTGGDNINLGIATTAIGQGRKAAVSIHGQLRGFEPRNNGSKTVILHDKMKLEWYKPADRNERKVLAPEERLANPDQEIDLGITGEQVLAEVNRCMSCGLCFACENCWMYCQNNCFTKMPVVSAGHFYKIKLEVCDGCKKCWEECPCGYIEGL